MKELTLKQMAEEYNKLAEKMGRCTVKKFPDKKTAKRRLEKAIKASKTYRPETSLDVGSIYIREIPPPLVR